MAESGRKNADNRVGIIVELHLSPQNSRISAKPAGPQAVADYDRFCETRHVVARTKHPSDVRGSAEHGKIVSTHLQQFEMLRTLSAGQVCRATLDSSHLVKDARSCSEIVQFRNGEPDVPRAYAAIAGDDLHQTLRMGKRKRTQQHRVHDAKNRRVRAHAQSQGKHRYDRKTRTLPKHSQSVPHIL